VGAEGKDVEQNGQEANLDTPKATMVAHGTILENVRFLRSLGHEGGRSCS